MEIFETQPGTLVTITAPGADVPMPLKVDGLDAASGGKVLVTSFGYDRAGRFQFAETLSDAIYGYAFGERMGVIQLSGVLFPRTCTDQSGALTGMELLERFYDDYRYGATNGRQPSVIVLGNRPVRGFLIAKRSGIVRAEDWLGQFTLTYQTVPEKLISTGPVGDFPTTGSGGTAA